MLRVSDAGSGSAALEGLGLRAPNTADGCTSTAARGVGQRNAEMGAVWCTAWVRLPMSGLGYAMAAALGGPLNAGGPVGSAGVGKGLPFDDRGSAEGTA